MNKNPRKTQIFKASLSLTKDFIWIYRLSMVGILIFGGLFLKFAVDQEQEKIEEKIFITAEQIEKSITYNVDYLKYQLYYATQQIKETKASEDKRKMEKVLFSFVNNINNQVDISIAWNAFSWVNKQNYLSVDGAVGIIKKPIDLSKRDYLQTTSKVPNKLVFGKPVTGSISERLIIPVGMGVFSEDGLYLGTLVFGLDIERILSKIKKLVGDKSFSFVVMQDRNIAFASDNFSEEEGSFAKKITTNIQDTWQSFGEGKIINSQNIFSKKSGFVYLQDIKNSPLKVLVFYDQDKSYQQLLNIFLKHAVFVLLVVFICAVLFKVIFERIVNPVTKLSQFALRISKKDFSFTTDRPSSKELANLFDTLNSVKEVAVREEILLKRLEMTNAKLSKANEAKAEFLAKSSHDIKNYIFGILGLSRIILDGKNNPEILQSEELQMVETIADQSEELMHFVEDLLDTNQIESGEFSLEKMQLCDINILISRIILLNKSLATRHHVLVKTDLESDVPKLRCDIRRMKQILVNLISNAIKYSPPKSVVMITAKYLKQEKKVYIEVLDEGIGMTESEVKILLAGRGKSIDKSNLENIDSYGIGMPIVLRLVKLHHGKIEIESVKGDGTKVKLYFGDFENAEAQDLLNQDDADEVSIRKNKSILMVEDNPVNIKITTKILRKAGYETYYVENGKEALKILDEKHFDLILMDGEMPVMNGYQATAKIREGKSFENFKNYKTIPIIALMSSSDSQAIKRAKDSGMNYHLEKSTSRTKLIDVVDGWLLGGKEE